ncbi:MAG: TRAP transporter substrate-binding protein DctP [Mailhella sp.]|nr:TRAP transporter substrate-binding protein DctP [Mailhella sp.]
MKLRFVAALAAAALLCFGAAPAEAKTWNLRFTGSDFEAHPSVANGLKPWFKDIEKATNGQVKIRYFNPNTIAGVNEVVSSLESGAIDMGTIDHARNAGRFPLHDVFVLPMLTGSSTAQGILGWRMLQESPLLQKEMATIKVLGYWGGGAMQVMTKDKPVKSLDDMKSLRIAALSKPIANAAAALGANPINIPVPDFYMALSRNTCDSALFSQLAAGSIKIQNMIKHVTLVSLIKDVRFIGINMDLWNSFPPEIQKAIESTCMSEEFAIRMSTAMDNADTVGHDLLASCGAQFYTLDPADHARWVAACAPLDQEWVEKVVKLGTDRKDAEALLKRVREQGAAITASLKK